MEKDFAVVMLLDLAARAGVMGAQPQVQDTGDQDPRALSSGNNVRPRARARHEIVSVLSRVHPHCALKTHPAA